jgi:hypothetical protein
MATVITIIWWLYGYRLSSAVLDRLQLRRVFSIQDHHFPPGLLRWQRMSSFKRSVIFKPLFGPRRCIAVPMVFYCITH